MGNEKDVTEQFKGMQRQDLSLWEGWGRKWFKRCLWGGPLLLFLIWLILLAAATHQLNSARRLAVSTGDSVNFLDYVQHEIPPEENASVVIERAANILEAGRKQNAPAYDREKIDSSVRTSPNISRSSAAAGPNQRVISGPTNLPTTVRSPIAYSRVGPVDPRTVSTGDVAYQDLRTMIWDSATLDVDSMRAILSFGPIIEALDVIESASPLTKARFETDYSAGPETRRIDYSNRTISGYLPMGRASLRMHDGKTEAAYDDILLSFRYNYWLAQEYPSDLSCLFSNQMMSHSLRTCLQMFKKQPPNLEQRNRLLDEYRRIRRDDYYTKNLPAGRAQMYYHTHPNGAAEDLADSFERKHAPLLGRKWVWKYPLRPLLISSLAVGLQMENGFIESRKKSTYALCNTEFLLSEQKFRQSWQNAVLGGFRADRDEIALDRFNFLTWGELFETACKLDDFRKADGAYPKSLDVFEKPPVDPFDGNTLRYLRTEEGYLLYSVGANLTDDGGMTSESHEAGDIVWSMP